MIIDRWTKGRIKLLTKGECLWWRSPSRGVTSNRAEAYLYTFGEFQEKVEGARKTGPSKLEFEPD